MLESSKLEPVVQKQVIPWMVGHSFLRNQHYLPPDSAHAQLQCVTAAGDFLETFSMHKKLLEMIEVPPKMTVCVCGKDLSQESGNAFMMVSYAGGGVCVEWQMRRLLLDQWNSGRLKLLVVLPTRVVVVLVGVRVIS